MGLAFYRRRLPNVTANQVLYELQPPMTVSNYEGESREVSWIIVSATVVLGQPETYIFEANKDGKVVNWSELAGSQRGHLGHERVLEDAGYTVETGDEHYAERN